MKRSILGLLLLSGVVMAGDFSRVDDVVVDNRTNLMWQDNAEANTTTRSWSGAITYCESLNLATHSDWRLPNFNELYAIADRSKSNPAMDATFTNVVSSGYWSSTTNAANSASAWVVFFYYGNGYYFDKTDTLYVRCVRDN